MLIAAELLVNGSTVVRDIPCSTVEHFPVELAEHSVIWAEAAARETLLDDGSRGVVHNTSEHEVLYPHQSHLARRWCARRVDQGFALEAARERIAALAPIMPGAGA